MVGEKDNFYICEKSLHCVTKFKYTSILQYFLTLTQERTVTKNYPRRTTPRRSSSFPYPRFLTEPYT